MLQQKASWNQLFETTNEAVSTEEITRLLLRARGLHDLNEQKEFLQPSLHQLQSPDGLHQMDIAYNRIQQAIEEQEMIVIYGDYDADGITSTAVLYKALTKCGALCSYYIPDRFTEGYGLNKGAIQFLFDEGNTLLITVDNGIASVDEVAFAKQLGMDVIITDHHEAQVELPPADAIIHPKISDDYDWKELAGVGVAFQLATKLLGEIDRSLLDLVAIGTIADLVPLINENRVLAYFGLGQMEQTSHIGLQKLMEQCRIETPIQEDDIGFRIGPRLNSVGRLDNAEHAVRLLVTEDEEEAEEIVAYIEELNKERQQIVTQIVKEAEMKMASLPDEGVIMLYDESWHEGVLGIAASRIVQKYQRPTFMFAHKENGELKGSARSIPAFDLFENCLLIKDRFVAFGGHSQAAGMTLSFDQLDHVWQFLNEQLRNQCTDADYVRQLHISYSLAPEQVTEKFVTTIQQFAPFGMGNEKPLFHMQGMPQTIRTLGQNQAHLKIQLVENQHMIDCIGFQKGSDHLFIGKTNALELVGYLQMNEWNGTRTPQLLIEDMRIKHPQVFDYRGKQQQLSIEQTLERFHTHVVYVEDKMNLRPIQHEKLLYISADDLDKIQEIDVLYLFDLPKNMEKIEQLLRNTKAKAIYLCYDMPIDLLFEQLPSRDDFKWLYGFIKQTKVMHVTEKMKEIIHQSKWKKEKVIFMVQVLLELQFIYLEERFVHINDNPKRKPLEEAPAYIEKIQEQQIVQLFYQERFDYLVKWIMEQLEVVNVPKEEVGNGL